MPTRTMRFCPKCLNTAHAAGCTNCGVCGCALRPLLDDHGAITGEFLTARGNCCDNGCRNCPYSSGESAFALNSAQTKTCERCGETFGCQLEGCWCESVKLGPETLQWLRRAFTDCLCPSCLSEMSVARS